LGGRIPVCRAFAVKVPVVCSESRVAESRHLLLSPVLMHSHCRKYAIVETCIFELKAFNLHLAEGEGRWSAPSIICKKEAAKIEVENYIADVYIGIITAASSSYV
jgi:hypothetical protein